MVINENPSPVAHYLAARSGNYRIAGRKATQSGSFWGMDGEDTYEITESWRNVALERKGRSGWKTVMADDPPTVRVLQKYAEQSRGKVLTAGMGLGIYLQFAAKNPDITQIYVSESAHDVVNMVLPQLLLGRDINVLYQDVWDMLLIGSISPDTIFLDLWDADAAPERPTILAEIQEKVNRVRDMLPQTTIIIHGFPELSDYWPIP